MDARIIVFFVIVLCVTLQGESKVIFDFHKKLADATTTTTENWQAGQVIRVPELLCPLGQRRDANKNCRQRL